MFHQLCDQDIRLSAVQFTPVPTLSWKYKDQFSLSLGTRTWENPIYPNAGYESENAVEAAALPWSLDLYAELFADPSAWYGIEPDYLALEPRSGLALGFYHSGVDVFSPKPEGVLNLTRQFRRWLPPPR